jgi:type III restriction enzyme
MAEPLRPREPNGIRIPLFLPRVNLRWVRAPFSLTRINLIDVEVLGQRFADDNGETLTRKALDAHRDNDGSILIDVQDRSADETVYASQTLIPFGGIETDLVHRLIRSNAVEATIAEQNAAIGIAQAFLRGARVTEDTPWREAHGRLATTALVSWIQTEQTSIPAREVAEVERVRWPDPAERPAGNPPRNRNEITNSRQFERWYPYSGWAKSFYDANSFDSYSAEFKLAEVLESAQSPEIKAWLRVNLDVPLYIPYKSGAITRNYIPDFIAIDAQSVYWIVEGKADNEMDDHTVLLKRDAAREWVNTVNASSDVHQRWAYLLVSESMIRNASGSWANLKAAGHTFQ